MGDRPDLTSTVLGVSDDAPTSRGLRSARPSAPIESSEVIPCPDPPEPRVVQLCCDQAVFTSIRSPMGEGYRLVAATPGVKQDEKIEITRRSPSHGSLCDVSPDAVALLSYPLKTGRRAIACCLHAGMEHTARGGLRVYTHLVLLEPPVFTELGADPVLLHQAILEHLRKEGINLDGPLCATRLSLVVSAPAPPPAAEKPGDCPHFAKDQVDHAKPATPMTPTAPAKWGLSPSPPLATRVAADLQADRRVIVIGPGEPIAFLRSVLETLPAPQRERLSVSAGLTYAPSRPVHLTVLPSEPAGLGRLIAGQDVTVHRVARS